VTILNKSLQHPTQGQPLTARGLLNTLIKIYKEKPKALNLPVIMSTDEEGNDMLKLYCIEVDKKGQVTLWPAHV
jgi:hypothetical protein